jgi:hypothetical protein
MSWVLWLKEVLGLLLLVMVVGSVFFLLWSGWKSYKSSQNNQRHIHTCKACSREFKCRDQLTQKVQYAQKDAETKPKTLLNSLFSDQQPTTGEDSEDEETKESKYVIETKEIKLKPGQKALKRGHIVVPHGKEEKKGIHQNPRVFSRERVPRTKNLDDEVKERPNSKPKLPVEKMYRRSGGNRLAGYQRKTVYAGNFPIEISEPTKICCATIINHNPERYCSYSCYRKLIQQK